MWYLFSTNTIVSVDRSMRIKEDVVENLNITHSTWQGERRQRELLQEHIRSVTELVRKMDRDIRVYDTICNLVLFLTYDIH